MLGVGLVKGQRGVHAFEMPMPEITEADEVLIRVKQVGLDGTDFNIVRLDLQDMAEGQETMTLGHEMTGVVEKVGESVSSFTPGDIVTMTARRGCGKCHPCQHNQSDMCMTGLFTERGIHKLNGSLQEFVVDSEDYIVKVPPEAQEHAVLSEPLSIVEKAIDQLRIIQSRLLWTCPHPEHAFLLPAWGGCKAALVLGAGTLGLLGSALLRMAEVAVLVADIVPREHMKASLVGALGSSYIEGTGKTAAQLMEDCSVVAGSLDIILEASGAAETAVRMIDYMSRDSIYVMTGIPRGDLSVEVDAAQLVRQMVRNNQVLVGSVNSNRSHFETALADLPRIAEHFSDFLPRIVTHRFGLEDYAEAFASPGIDGHIKTVVQVSE